MADAPTRSGKKSNCAAQLRAPLATRTMLSSLSLDENAVPFNPNAGWKEGDMLPRYFLQQAAGSAADNKAVGTWKNGMWTVLIIRPLGLTNADHKALRPGGVYNVGFAVTT